MKCEACSELLSQYIDKECSEKEHNDIKQHLEQCSVCAEEYKMICNTIDCVCQLECVEPPEHFQTNVMREIRKEQDAKKTIWPMWGSLSLGSLAAAALVMIAITNNPFESKQPTSRIAIAPQNPPTVIAKNDSNIQEQPWEDFHKKQISNPAKKTLARKTAPKQTNRLVRSVAYGKTSSESPTLSKHNENELYRQNHEWSGEDSKIVQKSSYVINNAQEAKQRWEEAGITPLPLTKLNWKKSSLVALFIGKQVGRGLEIQLENIQQSNGKIVVTYHVNKPLKTDSTKTSNPFLVFEIKKTNLSISFVEK